MLFIVLLGMINYFIILMKTIAKTLIKQNSCKNGLQSNFCVILGLQFGQEGKYKILDKLCEDYDYSVRFKGGTTSDPGKNFLLIL